MSMIKGPQESLDEIVSVQETIKNASTPAQIIEGLHTINQWMAEQGLSENLELALSVKHTIDQTWADMKHLFESVVDPLEARYRDQVSAQNKNLLKNLLPAFTKLETAEDERQLRAAWNDLRDPMIDFYRKDPGIVQSVKTLTIDHNHRLPAVKAQYIRWAEALQEYLSQ